DSFVLTQAKNKRAEPPSKVTPPQEKPAPRQKRAATAEPSAPSPQKAPKLPPQPGPNAILLSVAEMCSLLRISRATLIRMDKAGKLPGRIKLGGSVRFHRETVEAWLKELITPPAP
ncbi:MAG TPA: helix-turn-helix domain-containing protein, partial [Desulfuromonadaceae bacterium]